MATRTISLDQVRIAEPCPVPWDTMKGDDRRRYCSHCNLHVHNLSAMTEDAAQRLICNSAGRLCVAYFPDANGAVTPLEYREQKQPRYGWKLVAMIAALGGVASAVTTLIYRPKVPAAVAPVLGGNMMVAGAMAPVNPSPTTCPVVGDVMTGS
jgi:hypothetical protein